MPSYNRLTGTNRIELYALKKAGLTQKAIAAQLGVHPSTISRELGRNTGLRGYPTETGGSIGLRTQITGSQQPYFTSHLAKRGRDD